MPTAPTGPALNTGIAALDPGSNTPLGETLFQLYTYFMSRSAIATNRPLGADGTDAVPGLRLQHERSRLRRPSRPIR